MSNEKHNRDQKRVYQLKARAKRRDEVHRRITLAAVKLHQELGPAKTTMEGIARLAGVQRATVYNHFPTELDLLDACSSHWFADNPQPDPDRWLLEADVEKRMVDGLTELYVYYSQGQEMIEKNLHDAPHVPALKQIIEERWEPLMARMVECLGGRRSDKKVWATLTVAVDFFTWKKLTDSGHSPKAAARLAASWVLSTTR